MKDFSEMNCPPGDVVAKATRVGNTAHIERRVVAAVSPYLRLLTEAGKAGPPCDADKCILINKKVA